IPKTSRPTSSASVIASSNSLRCRAGSTARPDASTVAATKLSTPICIMWLLFCFLPQRLECAAPRDELIQHLVDRLFLCWTGLEDAEVFEVGIHGEQDLKAHGGHLHLRQDQTQLLDRARATGAAIAHEAGRLVGPLGVQKIDRVFERARDSMVVLRRDKDIAVERTDLGGPYFGVRLTVLPHYWWNRFVEKRQVEILDVDKLELDVAALFGDFMDPLRYRLTISIRARASDNDCDPKHRFLLDGLALRDFVGAAPAPGRAVAKGPRKRSGRSGIRRSRAPSRREPEADRSEASICE